MKWDYPLSYMYHTYHNQPITSLFNVSHLNRHNKILIDIHLVLNLFDFLHTLLNSKSVSVGGIIVECSTTRLVIESMCMVPLPLFFLLLLYQQFCSHLNSSCQFFFFNYSFTQVAIYHFTHFEMKKCMNLIIFAYKVLLSVFL